MHLKTNIKNSNKLKWYKWITWVILNIVQHFTRNSYRFESFNVNVKHSQQDYVISNWVIIINKKKVHPFSYDKQKEIKMSLNWAKKWEWEKNNTHFNHSKQKTEREKKIEYITLYYIWRY